MYIEKILDIDFSLIIEFLKTKEFINFCSCDSKMMRFNNILRIYHSNWSSKIVFQDNCNIKNNLQFSQIRRLYGVLNGHLYNLNCFLNLKELQFHNWFNNSLEKNVLPRTLTHLTFGDYFDKQLNDSILDSTLTHLTFGSSFDKSLKGVLPNTLTHLTLGVCFNQPLEGVLPSTLTHLILGYKFNHPLVEGVFPDTLTHLTLGLCFNRPLKYFIFPTNLIYLKIGNKSMKKVFGQWVL